MKVYKQSAVNELSQPVVTMGLFDGVHLGHQALIKQVVQLGKQHKKETLIITYWPHPRIVLGNSDSDFKLLTTLDEKIWLLEKLGINHCWVIPFTTGFAATPPPQFITDYLTKYFIPSYIVIGDDHRFGQNAGGDFDLLKQAGFDLGFEIEHLTTHRDGLNRISSSYIRSSLKTNDLASANRLLGYPFILMGKVDGGKKLGRSIGFPTANIDCCDTCKQVPSDGVYAVKVDWKNQCFDGMLNIGIRPTIEDHHHKTIEVHLFDQNVDLYGEVLRIHFIERLRDEMKFSGVEELRSQLMNDKVNARAAIDKWHSLGKSYLCKE